MNLLFFIATLIALEIALFLVVNLQRRSISWLITGKDEIPAFDPVALRKFIDSSFDPHLGWVRKPNSSGVENGKKGKITFHVDSTGSRSHANGKLTPVIAAFGDSYAFCRQVEDDETWEAQLSLREDFGVLNYGVGNYGIDQGLLRYEGMTLPGTVKVAVMGFVPETICRVQSYWKHYLEFGNTFAFKPRFVLGPEGRLVLHENLMRGIEDFARLREKLPEVRKVDAFYESKFRSHQFRFPYIFSLARNPLKQSALIFAVALRGAARAFGVSKSWLEDLPFALVMRSNILDSHQLYRDARSTELLKAIFLRFQEEARSRGHTPLVLVMPQLMDLKLSNGRTAPYQAFFLDLAREMPVIDVTDKFNKPGFEKLYVNDQYGGHPSVEGNRLVAEEISAWLKNSGVNQWHRERTLSR